MKYLPHTDSDIAAMLARIGLPSLEALFADVPAAYRQTKDLQLPAAMSEVALTRHLSELAARNTGAGKHCLLGGGFYDHHIPPTVDQLLLRSEFYTAYTPYQAEVAQGTLQAMFEFQSVVAELFDLDVANASMYDAASAAAEAVLMARRLRPGRRRLLLSAGLHPQHRATIATYLSGQAEVESHILPLDAGGCTDIAALRQAIDGETAAVVLGYPNVLGSVDNPDPAAEIAHAHDALLITVTTEPYALGLIQPPGALGADIAVGEGQALAVPPQYGGPGVGLFTCRQAFLRAMPGRLVGQTTDADGHRGFVLTLSTREQHIRRERATSNICTNHGLIALALLLRTALLGRRGLEQTAALCLARSEYLKGELSRLPGLSLPYSAPTFNEFVVRSTQKAVPELLAHVAQAGFLLGPHLPRCGLTDQPQDFLVAVTEKHSREDLDALVEVVRGFL